jgi:Na+-transporting methylmalonyl-CoA/oxaloacetate decarboxylase gamma subunit
MLDSMTLIVIGVGIVALVVSFIEYTFASKKRLKAENR